MIRTVEIQNVGPIERLSIPLPEAGVVVLRGRNGAGKSHALAAIDSLVSGRGRPPCRDGAAKGVIEGFGAKLTIGRSTRRTGEAEVVTLEGRLDISQLVQPPIKDEESADRQRIKALIQLSGAVADPSTFAEIVPDGVAIGELVPPSEQTDDPVVLAGRVKRALEAEARRYERAAEEARAKADALAAEASNRIGDGHVAVVSRQEAETMLQAALVRAKEIEAKASEVARQREKAAKAKETLDALMVQVPPDQTEEALAGEVATLDDQIAKLRRALDIAYERRTQLQRQLDQLRLLLSHITVLRQQIADVPEPIPPDEIERARTAVEMARGQHDLAVRAEQCQAMIAQAERARAEAAQAERLAGHYRQAAAATDEVLSRMVGRVTARLRVEGGRLVCDTDRGGEPFGELSPGERWRIALEIAAEQVGRGGLVTVPQEAWESLDPVNRAEVAEIARQVGVVILTAEADAAEIIQAEIVA